MNPPTRVTSLIPPPAGRPSGLEDRERLLDEFAMAALAGYNASETEESGFSDTYLDAAGNETSCKRSPNRNETPTTGPRVDWLENKLLRSAAQNKARACYDDAWAMLAEKDRRAEAFQPVGLTGRRGV